MKANEAPQLAIGYRLKYQPLTSFKYLDFSSFSWIGLTFPGTGYKESHDLLTRIYSHGCKTKRKLYKITAQNCFKATLNLVTQPFSSHQTPTPRDRIIPIRNGGHWHTVFRRRNCFFAATPRCDGAVRLIF